MKTRYCSVYCKPVDTSGLHASIELFESNGIRLRRPDSETICRLDEYGDHVESSLIDIECHFQKVGIVDFLMWADAQSQLYVQFHKLTADVHRQEYEFSALRGTPGLDLFWKAMSIIFDQALSSGHAIAMIIDEHGHTEGFNWDSFITVGGRIPLEMPDYLALIRDKADPLISVFESFQEGRNGVWSYRRDDWLGPDMAVSRI